MDKRLLIALLFGCLIYLKINENKKNYLCYCVIALVSVGLLMGGRAVEGFDGAEVNTAVGIDPGNFIALTVSFDVSATSTTDEMVITEPPGVGVHIYGSGAVIPARLYEGAGLLTDTITISSDITIAPVIDQEVYYKYYNDWPFQTPSTRSTEGYNKLRPDDAGFNDSDGGGVITDIVTNIIPPPSQDNQYLIIKTLTTAAESTSILKYYIYKVTFVESGEVAGEGGGVASNCGLAADASCTPITCAKPEDAISNLYKVGNAVPPTTIALNRVANTAPGDVTCDPATAEADPTVNGDLSLTLCAEEGSYQLTGCREKTQGSNCGLAADASCTPITCAKPEDAISNLYKVGNAVPPTTIALNRVANTAPGDVTCDPATAEADSAVAAGPSLGVCTVNGPYTLSGCKTKTQEDVNTETTCGDITSETNCSPPNCEWDDTCYPICGTVTSEENCSSPHCEWTDEGLCVDSDSKTTLYIIATLVLIASLYLVLAKVVGWRPFRPKE